MITSIRIEDIRGIRAARLDGLMPITVLVGRNGAGKSAVLEALAIGAGHQPGELIGRVVQARGGWNGSRWLLRRTEAAPEASISLTRRLPTHELQWTTGLSYMHPAVPTAPALDPGEHPGEAYSSIEFVVNGRTTRSLLEPERRDFDAFQRTGVTFFNLANWYRFTPIRRSEALSDTRFVHVGDTRKWPLHETLQAAAEVGRLDAAYELLREVLGPGFRELVQFPEGRNANFNVQIRWSSGSVPVDVAGDGHHCLVRLVLELAGHRGGLVLLEEPEIHLHPGALRSAAAAVAGAMRRGVQIVMSTHDLEWIDALCDSIEAEQLDETLAVFRLAPGDLEHAVRRVSGSSVAVARQQLDQDLR